MEKFKVTPELETETENLIEQINTRLAFLDAPQLSLSQNPIDKADAFVSVNKWLQTVNQEDLVGLIDDYGLIPIILFMTNIDLTHAQLLQDTNNLEYSGFVRYLDAAIIVVTGGKSLHIRRIGQQLFKDEFKLDKNKAMRSKMISNLIEHYINSEFTYSQAVLDLIILVEF